MTNVLTKKELTYCKEIIESTIFNISKIRDNLEKLNDRYDEEEEEIKILCDKNNKAIKNDIDDFLKKLKIFHEFAKKLETICEENLKKSKLEEKYILKSKITEFKKIIHNENNTFELKDLRFLQNDILENLILELNYHPLLRLEENGLKDNNLEEAKNNFFSQRSTLLELQNKIKNFLQDYDRDDFFQFDNFEKIKKIPEQIYNSEDSQKQIIFMNVLSEFDFEIKDYHKKIFNFLFEEKLKNDKWFFKDNISLKELSLSKKFKINLLEKLLYARQIQLEKQNEYEANDETLTEFFNYLFNGIKFNTPDELNNLDKNDYSSISQKIKKLMEIYNENVKEEKKAEEAILTKDVKGEISNVSANLIGSNSGSSAVLFKVDIKNRILYFVTNKHCVQNLKYVSIQILHPVLESKKLLNIFSSDQILKDDSLPEDIAFIKIKHDNIDINNFEDPKVFEGEINENDIVIASGNTEGKQIFGYGKTNFTTGKFLNINIRDKNELNHNAKIKNGNSGGGLFNSKCELIGINYAKNCAYGFGSAVPIKRVKEIFNGFPEIKKQEAEEKQERNFSKFKKHLGVFIISDLIAASVIYFSMKKLIENNKLQNMNKNLAFGCIALLSAVILFFEIKTLINDRKEILSTKTEIEGLETLIKNKPVIPSS